MYFTDEFEGQPLKELYVVLKKQWEMRRDSKKVVGKTKYFCVGRNKTGTTSLKRAFEDLGFIVGQQDVAEYLYDQDYHNGQYNRILDYCKSAEVFQDIPFAYARIIPHLDKAYPGSKFILTLRDDSEQWYQSITRFHAKKFSKGNLTTAEELRQSNYRSKGFMYKTVVIDHCTSEEEPYNKKQMIKHYEAHNQAVLDYFKNRPSDLLVINVSEKTAYRKFIDFIGSESHLDSFPWENKT